MTVGDKFYKEPRGMDDRRRDIDESRKRSLLHAPQDRYGYERHALWTGGDA
jgi:hypothetical protein